MFASWEMPDWMLDAFMAVAFMLACCGIALKKMARSAGGQQVKAAATRGALHMIARLFR